MGDRKLSVDKTATEALLSLWQQGFFKAWKNKGAIDASLAKRGNHFSTPELGMALKRAKHLTRRGKRSKYEYIQKYPFAEEQNLINKKKPT